MRLDQYVSEKTNLSRNKAQALIKSWNVKINWKIIAKVWLKLDWDEEIKISLSEESNYVARSALKLKYFLEEEFLDISWYTAMDIWSSTWWFCQVMLEKNINKIYAIDVWTSQLHEKIRNDEKVISIENTDIRKLETLPESLDLITCDVSFISLELIIDSIISHMNEKTTTILLFKPQFEVWNKYINKKWVAKDEKIIQRKLNDFLDLCKIKWLEICKIVKSRLEWESGNKEIVIMLNKK
jgi:23S rRNA (cytidine1920-2'-O)/16S rRNA (cytidine1409-2'-O)-methyltransferase